MELPFISEFKTEQRVILFLYLIDVLTIAAMFFCGWALSYMVHSSLKTVFVIFNVIVGFLITRSSKTNPKKRFYEAVIIYFMRDTKIYKPIFPEKITLGKKE